MANKDGDKIYNDSVEKIKDGVEITKQDIISLTFTSIMGGKTGIADKIINATDVVKDINNDYKYDVESILYAFANKFLSEKHFKKIKSLPKETIELIATDIFELDSIEELQQYFYYTLR